MNCVTLTAEDFLMSVFNLEGSLKSCTCFILDYTFKQNMIKQGV